MRRAVILCGAASFVMAFLGDVLAFSLVAAPQATAQSGQLQEVRASAFTLVSPDGTVFARLDRNAVTGNSVLQMNDSAGTRRLSVVGAGVVIAYDLDGTTPAFRVGYTPYVDAAGRPPMNGVQLGPDGSISVLPPSP